METIWTTANLPQQAKSVISPIDGPVHQPVTHTKPVFFLMQETKWSFVTRISNFFLKTKIKNFEDTI